MNNVITRRRALTAAASLALLPSLLNAKQTNENITNDRNSEFHHGVASGDPDHSSIILWTRITTTATRAKVNWELATDNQFNNVVQTGEQITDADRDYTIKVFVDKLTPGTTYFYRFKRGTIISEIGRTSTLPNGHVKKLGIAVVSCSNFPFGYFNAYDAIAQDTQINIVLHLGDYIYEYGPDGFGGKTGEQISRPHMPAKEIISLQDYRERHAQYKGDAGSRAMHAAHPLVAIWDDHESANNPWMHGAENHQPENEDDWDTRKAVSLQAYYEWMPIREPGHGMNRAEYWRHFQFGDLASLVTLESRHTGRSQQASYAEHIDLLKSESGTQKFVSEILGDPSRNMLSEKMEIFLEQSLKDSVAAKRPWRLIGNQIPIARTNTPPLTTEALEALNALPDTPYKDEIALMQLVGAHKQLPLYLDTWDGYPAARERFYQLCQRAQAQDLLILTGDSHSFWKNQLFDQNGQPMGVELGTSGITSPGDFLRFGSKASTLLDNMLTQHNPEVLWTDNTRNGYIRLALTHTSAQADYVAVDNVLTKKYRTFILRSDIIKKHGETLVYSDA